MSQRNKRSLGVVLTLLAAVGIGWAAVVGAAVGGADREITLEARDMAFYLPGDPTPNPTLRVTAGERVRLVLVNRDPGMKHDLAVDALGVATRVLTAAGTSASVVLEVPDRSDRMGELDYVCTLHPQLMRGRLVVSARPF
jgi:plastocyanin